MVVTTVVVEAKLTVVVTEEVVEIVVVCVGIFVEDDVKQGALHCLGQDNISVGSEHVKMTHSTASWIAEAQSKYWQRVPEKPGEHTYFYKHIDFSKFVKRNLNLKFLHMHKLMDFVFAHKNRPKAYK